MDHSLDLSGETIDKYQVKRKIGNGSFGAVYYVFDMALQSEKAIKILDIDQPEKALALLKEAEIPFKCRHKNIVTINEANVFPVQGDLKVVIDMELVNGGSLEGIHQTQYIPIIDGLKLLSDALYGLEYAHINGIIHRDIKPANILIHNGIPKISDFGLAVPNGTEINPWIWYRTHAAPEVFSDSVATFTSDIFAFGMTLYRMVNNIPDWRDYLSHIDNANELMRSGKLINKLPFHPIVPNKVKQIVRKACKINPTERYQSAAGLRNAIDKLKFNCRWEPISEQEWEGRTFKDNDNFRVIVNVTKTKNEFVVKKNGRSISAEARIFSTKNEAITYMYHFISTNTVH